MDCRYVVCWLVVIWGGCAHSNALPPFPSEWPLDGVELPHPADALPGEVLADKGPPAAAPSAVISPPCATPDCLPGVGLPGMGVPGPPGASLLPNPIFVPVANFDAAWESIVDIVDDYFRIAREERVQLIENVLTEGRIETYPQVGATLLEPHRPDSAGAFNRLLATFQTIRRIGLVRVVPAEGGYQVEVVVETQVEDLPHPEHATVGAATLPADTSIPDENRIERPDQPLGVWYPIGRDVALEQQILAEIRGCLDVAPPGVVY